VSCKRCGLTFPDRISLMNHAREAHPKAKKPLAKAQGVPALGGIGEGGALGNGAEEPMSPALDPQEQFKALLERWKVKDCDVTAEFVASQGTDVFEDPVKMADALRQTTMDAPKRQLVMKHWFATKSIPFTAETLAKASPSEMGAGRVFAVDPETGSVRQSLESERGLTLAEAEHLGARIRAQRQGSPAADQQMAALTKTLDEMKAEIAKQREEALQSQLGAVRTELQGLKSQLMQAQQEGQQKNEYTTVEKVLTTIDNRMAGLEGLLRSVIVRPLPQPMPRAERQALAEGLAVEAQNSAQLDALERQLWPETYGPGRPAASPMSSAGSPGPPGKSFDN